MKATTTDIRRMLDEQSSLAARAREESAARAAARHEQAACISERQVARFHAIAREEGWGPELDVLLSRFGANCAGEIWRSHYDDAIRRLREPWTRQDCARDLAAARLAAANREAAERTIEARRGR